MKKLSLVSAGIMSMSALVLGVSPVFADVVTPTVDTEATVQFQVDDTTVPPVTPPTTGEGNENGGGTVDPEKPGTDGESGDGNPSFNITHVSNFRFNKKKAFNETTQTWAWEPIDLNANGMTLYAYGTDLTLFRQNSEGNWINGSGEVVEDEADAQKLAYKDLPNFIQITDNRGNKEAGWKLEVSRTQFTSGTDELAGATLSLNDAEDPQGPANVIAPTVEPTLATTGFEIPLEEDGAKTLMNAAVGTGTGSWSLSFGTPEEDDVTVADTEDEENPVTYHQLALVNGKPKSGVKLVVPAAAQAQTGAVYKSAITWTLSSVPEV